MDIMGIIYIMDIMGIMANMDIMEIMDIKDIMNISAWMAMAGAVSALFTLPPPPIKQRKNHLSINLPLKLVIRPIKE